jgi:hypothetical protein
VVGGLGVGGGGEGGEGVFVGGEEFGVRGPGLALGRDVLAGVLLGWVCFVGTLIVITYMYIGWRSRLHRKSRSSPEVRRRVDRIPSRMRRI